MKNMNIHDDTDQAEKNGILATMINCFTCCCPYFKQKVQTYALNQMVNGAQLSPEEKKDFNELLDSILLEKGATNKIV
jgi:hypothetical protein